MDMLVGVVPGMGAAYWYYNTVDLAWMLETQMPADEPAAALEGSGVATLVGIVSPPWP